MTQRSDFDNASAGQPAIYQIRLRGHLGSQWSEWFEGLDITLEEGGVTLLSGPVADQAALHGLLRKVRDVGLPLLSVMSAEAARGMQNESVNGHILATSEGRHMTAQTEADPGGAGRQPGAAYVTGRSADVAPGRLARIAGVLYVTNIILGAFAIGYVESQTIVSGDPTATAHAILAHEVIFRAGIVAHLLTLSTNIPMAVIFYDLFKLVSRRAALLVVFFTLVATAVEAANLLPQFTTLALLGGSHTFSALPSAQVYALAYAPLVTQGASYSIQQVIYSGYLLATGYLIYRSTYLPRALGVLLVIGALCYLTYSFADILAPAFAALLVPYIQIPSGLAEIGFALWLLIAGVNESRWRERAGAAGALASA
jgi:uncharacterized protein DUF4386